jgi:glycerol-3-phosphate dehydrogenase (NAD(P)+)
VKIAVIGAGAWGTTMAIHTARNGHEVSLWAFETSHAARMRTERVNTDFLPGHRFPDGLAATDELPAACEVLVGAVPTQYSRGIWERLRRDLPRVPFVSLAKGIEIGTGLLPTQIYREVVGEDRPAAVLTGPCIAREIAQGLPAAVVVAGDDAAALQEVFNSERFRVYTSDDRLGAELSSALKNVLAIAAGIVDGMGLGDNTKAALLTRGTVEMARLGVALGADKRTFSGLAGFGDLFTTCVSPHSRNRTLGERIGGGESLEEIIAGMTAVAEGVPTTRAVLALARDVGVEMPIAEALHRILFEGVALEEALGMLMTRDRRAE